MLNTLLNLFSNTNIFYDKTENFVKSKSAYISEIINGNGSFNEALKDNVLVFRNCKRILADTISMLPLKVLDQDGKPLKEHYLYTLLKYNVNGYTTSNTFKAKIINDINDCGNSFWFIEKEGGRPVQLQRISNNICGYRFDEMGRLIYQFKEVHTDRFKTILKVENDTIEVFSTEVLHFKSSVLDHDGIMGLNPIRAAMKQFDGLWQAYTTSNNYYKNNLHSNKYIKSTDAVDNNEFEAGVEDWASKYAGSKNGGKLSVLPFGVDLVEVKLDFADAMLLDSIKMNTAQIASSVGVQNWMVGIDSNMSFKSLEEAMLSFEKMPITPLCVSLREELEYKLLFERERKEGVSIEFNMAALMAADIKSRGDWLEKTINTGTATRFEWAKKEGFEIFDGEEAMKLHFIQSQYQPMESAYDPETETWNPVTSGVNPNNNNQNDNESSDDE